MKNWLSLPVLVILLCILCYGCGSAQSSQLSNENVEVIQIWSHYAEPNPRTATAEERPHLIEWIQSAKKVKEKDCCPEEKPPYSEVVLTLKNKQEIKVSYWGANRMALHTEAGSYWIEQAELADFLEHP